MAKEMTRTQSVTADDWSARSKMMTVQNQKLGWGTRVAYASGDVACNVVFGMVGTLLTLFYTDYAGINPGTVGLMMLLSRLFDGVSDLIMGIIVEKTNSKWGIKTMDFMDECTICFIRSTVIYGTAHHPDVTVFISVCNV